MWLILLLCLIWGFNFTIMKLALDYFPPVLFSSIRFLLASIILLIICFYKKIPFPRKQDWKWYAICGILQTSFQFIANQQALQYIDSGLTSLLCYTMPIWFALMAHFMIGERLTKLKTGALILGMIGLFLVLQINPFQIEWKGMTLLAQLLVLSGAIAWAVSNIIVKKVLDNHNKWQFTAYQMVIGTFVLFLYSIFVEQEYTVIWGWESIAILLYSGVMASAVAYTLWTYLLGSGEGGKVSISLMLVPVIGIISGSILLGERLSFISMVGIFLILAALILVNKKENQPVNKIITIKTKTL